MFLLITCPENLMLFVCLFVFRRVKSMGGWRGQVGDRQGKRENRLYSEGRDF